MRCKVFLAFTLCLFILISCTDNDVSPPEAEIIDLSQPWVNDNPQAQFVDDLTDVALHASGLPRLTSLIIVRNGKLIHEAYYNGFKRDSLHDVRSVTKSVLGLLVGIAVTEGFVESIDDPISEYLSEDEVALSEEQKTITIDHLLTMSAGFQWNELNGNAYNEWALSGEPVQFLLDKPIISEPGTLFNYNSAATHLLGVTLTAATGMSLPDFATQYLFNNIGIDLVGWETVDEQHVNGGSGIRLKALDMARLGQLMLQSGKSGDRQFLTQDWIASLVSPAYTWRNDYGVLRQYTYGKLWWVHDISGGPHYLSWGYGGQFIYIVPSKNLVVVTTSNWHFLSQEGGAFNTEQENFNLILNMILPKVR